MQALVLQMTALKRQLERVQQERDALQQQLLLSEVSPLPKASDFEGHSSSCSPRSPARSMQ
jgi:hypothetical protein